MVIMVLADHHAGRPGGMGGDGAPQSPPARALDANPATSDRPHRSTHRWRIGCDTCGLVSRAAPGMRCPRCGFRLHDRKPGSIAADLGFLLAGGWCFTSPPISIPVLTVVQLGAGQPSTILGGVRELLELGMWPLAALVFFASIAVPRPEAGRTGDAADLDPVAGRAGALHDRTVLYRIVDAIGRWSMIDIFMESILVALVQFGSSPASIPAPARSPSPRW